MSNAETGEPQVGTVYRIDKDLYKLIGHTAGFPEYVRWVRSQQRWSGGGFQDSSNSIAGSGTIVSAPESVR